MASFFGFIQRVSAIAFPPSVSATNSEPIKFGILGAAKIAPAALISPAKTHPEVVVHAVAARDKQRATAYAKKHGIPTVYGGPTSYQGRYFLSSEIFQPSIPSDLLDDPEINAIYNPVSILRLDCLAVSHLPDSCQMACTMNGR